MADPKKQYPRMYQPGRMVGEDVHPITGKPLSTYHPLMTPGVMVGEDMYPRSYQPGVMVGEDVDPGISNKPIPLMTPGVMVGEDQVVPEGRTFNSEASLKGSGNQLYGPGGSPTGSGQSQARQGNRPFVPSPYIDGTETRPQPGQYSGFDQRYQADENGVYREVNIVQRGQPATLNGQAVRADGKGNWIGFGGRVVGTYKLGENRTPINTTPAKTETIFKNISKPSKETNDKNKTEEVKTEQPLTGDSQLILERESTQELRNTSDLEGGIDTRTGTKFENFQAQQQDLMDRRAGLQTEFSPEGISPRNVDPRTAELIRGIPRNPFSSTSLPYTDFSEDGPQFDIGIDPSKMLSRMEGIDFSEDAKGFTDFSKGITLKDGFTEDYVSPVNFNAPQNSGDPMLNPDIDSATALQMKNRDAGLMYASGQFFAEGEGGQPVLVNRDLAKDVRSGKEGAQAQLDAYLAGGGMRPKGSEENPGFGVIENISPDKMFEMSQTTPEQIADSGYSAEDMESFGVPEASAKGMGQGDYVQYYNEGDFDENISDGTLIDGGITPFTQKLLR